ncbi:helix-turn-helix domain-containing protein [Leisingera sp. F5]|uniref:helix-turn-helix domain-containing protein n=1 Tax=Leisingera sp. F5 TaxID=1813816 RepID=UPI000AD14640|nr:helix-turn-helix domain-containing protein [Leisingera sp. F5]
MGAVYSRLSITERRKIERWRHAKTPVNEMARVLGRLKNGWMPEQIGNRMIHEGARLRVCQETIYRYIHSKEGIGRVAGFVGYLHTSNLLQCLVRTHRTFGRAAECLWPRAPGLMACPSKNLDAGTQSRRPADTPDCVEAAAAAGKSRPKKKLAGSFAVLLPA